MVKDLIQHKEKKVEYVELIFCGTWRRSRKTPSGNDDRDGHLERNL